MQDVAIDLQGVPETMLWPLWNRANEHRLSNALIEDPWADELVTSIDYDFESHFGKPSVFHAIRARVADDLLRSYHARLGEDATVVALGEGLDSQRLRTEIPGSQWVSVDLPEALDVRRSLLPRADEERMVPCSALDPQWLDALECRRPPFITALGLFMYFEEAEVKDLLERIATALPGAEILFDTIPPFFSKKTVRGHQITDEYVAPPMPWGIEVTRLAGFLRSANWTPLRVQTYAEPFPKRLRFYWMLSKIRPLRAALAGGLAHARSDLLENDGAASWQGPSD
ncbi:MAG: class I SAM-dependent methyltransferase [Planctomycetota bacterium]